jgi:hypothetical protein
MDPSEEINLGMMKDQHGKEISKFSLGAMAIGEDATAAMRKLFRTSNMRYVGDDSVFPTESCAPKILTAFKDNPSNFELREGYTTGVKPRKLPSVKATYYHGKPTTRRILEHFARATPVVSRCDHPRCLSRLATVPKRDPGTTKDSACWLQSNHERNDQLMHQAGG